MKQQLLESAARLKPPSVAQADEFRAKCEQMAITGNRMLSDRADIANLIGKNNRQMAEDNNRNFARFMTSLFNEYNSIVLVETVLWVFRAYRAHGFNTTYWAANLNIWTDLLKTEMSADTFDTVYPFYHWLIVNIPLFTTLTDDFVSTPGETIPDHG